MSDPSLEAVAAELGLPLSAAQGEALSVYLALLQRWNGTYNLTAVRDPAAMRVQHIADCLAIIPALRRAGVRGRVMDVGSGGGLPGVLMALMQPELEIECVDAVAKKVAFVRQVAATLKLGNLRATHARVETLRTAAADLIISRAFASLADFTRLTRAALAPGGVWVAMKGRPPEEERAELPADIEVFHVEPLTVPGLEAQRCLVWMRPAPALTKN